MNTSPYSDQEILAITEHLCKVYSRPYGGHWREVLGLMYEKLSRNLQKLVLDKPLRYYATVTIRLEIRRYFLDQKRRNRRERSLNPKEDDRANDGRTRDKPRTVQDELIQQERNELLRRLIDRLAPDHRESLLVKTGTQELAHIGESLPDSVAEAAKLQGCSPQNIYKKCKQAYESIRSQLS